MNQDQVKKIRLLAEKYLDQAIQVRRKLHQYPELSENEAQTAKTICAFLDQHAIPYTRSKDTWAVTALIQGKKPSKVPLKGVAIRADIDALPILEKTNLACQSKNPGVMHACGHDFHAAIALGLGCMLKDLSHKFSGSIKLLFQPAEETIGGAERMIQEGCLENPKIDYVLGLHIDPLLESGAICLLPGSINAASTEFSVKILGRSTHAAHPDQGVDPITIACTAILNLQNILAKKLPPTDLNLVTVSQIHAGEKNNIIPGEASFSGIIRTHNLALRSVIKDHIRHGIQEISAAYGGQAAVTFTDSYPNLVNDQGLYEKLTSLAKENFPPDKVITSGPISMGADDFAYFSQACPSFFVTLGTHKKGTPKFPLHNDHLAPDEEAIVHGLFFEALASLSLLEGPDDPRRF